MFSCVDELSRFALAFVNGGRLEGQQVLSRTLVAKLSTPFADIPAGPREQKSSYGFIVEDYRGVRMLSVGGSWGGFTAQMRLVPAQRFGVIILANRNASLFNASAEQAMELMLPLQPAPPTRLKNPLPMSASEMASYLGTYANEDVVEILSKGSRLFLRERGVELPVTKWGAELFSVRPNPTSQLQVFALIKGADGKVRYLHRAGRALKKRIAQNDSHRSSP
jgi:CubicO group peptidase (beta-lactamase class C family)